MNQKGFGFKEFILILGVIFFALLVTIAIYKATFKKTEDVTDPIDPEKEQTVETTETYQDLENKLNLAAQRYQNDNYQGTLESEETWILTYSMLKKEKYLKQSLIDVTDQKTECDGYVRFEKKAAHITYTPYIKCGTNYTTKGYDSYSA